VNIKNSKTKIIFRTAFLLIFIYVMLTMYTNNIKSFSDVINYKPYVVCPENVDGLQEKKCFNPYYDVNCVDTYITTCPKPYLNAGETLGTKPNIFYDVGTNLIFFTLVTALYINWLYLKREK